MKFYAIRRDGYGNLKVEVLEGATVEEALQNTSGYGEDESTVEICPANQFVEYIVKPRFEVLRRLDPEVTRNG